jgi:protein-L-isoaspartate(D-aspartate) O-methyltransferase
VNGLTAEQSGRFDVIVVAGGLNQLPEQLQKQLNVGGRLLAFVGELPMMRITDYPRIRYGIHQQRSVRHRIAIAAGCDTSV